MADAGLLCDEFSVLRDTMNWTCCRTVVEKWQPEKWKARWV